MLKIGLNILISLFILVAATPLFSTEISYQKCLDIAGTTNASIQECNEKEMKHQDKLLNKYYKQAMKHLSDEKKEKKNLKLAQRAWIKFRDLDCKSRSYPMRDGTGEYTMYQNCMIEVTDERIRVLKNEY